MSTLTFLKYNNYYNRILKNHNVKTISSFTNNYPNRQFTNLNFDPKDGVDTVHYINIAQNDTLFAAKEFPFDYLLVSNDGATTCDSKWYVIDAVWNRKGQWRIVLHRDVLADHYDDYYNKKFFCRKGMPESTSPLVYQSEGKQYNQILKSRNVLKRTSSQTQRYIVGFVDKTWSGGNLFIGDYVKVNKEDTMPRSGYLYRFANTELGNKVSQANFYVFSPSGNKLYYVRASLAYSNGDIDSNLRFAVIESSTDPDTVPKISITENSLSNTDAYRLFGTSQSNARNNFLNAMKTDNGVHYTGGAWISAAQTAYVGKNVMYDGSVYTVSEQTGSYAAIEIVGRSNVQEAINELFDQSSIVSSFHTEACTFYANCATENVIYTEQQGIAITPASSDINGLPYNIFALEDSDEAREFAGYFASQYAGGHVLYDIQLVPFVPTLTGTPQTFIIDNKTLSLYWLKTDSDHFVMYNEVEKSYSSVKNKKIGANQDMCRLIAPNGSSSWEFNPSLIGGITSTNINCEFTLIPYSSYFHIFPTFSGLYGAVNKSYTSDTTKAIGETRGLVFTGPFSLPYSTDNWATYQLQNSAYKDSFDRQIENMAVVQDVDRWKDITGASLGVLSGAINGGVGGANFGPVGVAAGAVMGTATSLGAGMIDVELNELLRKEQVNYTKDQFYNSLRNIQAQARPLQSNNAITIGASWFPIIELYESTSDEQSYMEEDLRVHGWTMGVATTFETVKSTIESYGNPSSSTAAPTRYIQGDLMQVGLNEDFHIANEIVKELNMGVYLWQI